MSLRLPTDFNHYRGAHFTIRFRLNRITLRRQYHALTNVSTRLRRFLFPSAADVKPIRSLSRAEIDGLNLVNEIIRDDDQQLQTVISILEQPKGTVPFIIFGPPGTGKTTALVESIMQLVRRDSGIKVLACAPSNSATDLLVERLAGAGLGSDELYRLNAYSRNDNAVPENVQSFSIIPKHEALLAFRVVLSTCSSVAMLQTLNVPVGHFSHIVIDEAAQAEEPLVMIPIMTFSNADTNIILAGDPNQLRPVIKSPTASRAGLRESYLERLMLMREVYGLDNQKVPRIVDLQRNRRSHGSIIAWPNRYLYEDRMRAYGNVEITHLLANSDILPKKDFPLIFHGVKGAERQTKWSPSYFNISEASIVRDYCVQLTMDRQRKIYPEDIGIIAPYRAQVRTIRLLLKMARLANISVGSVEQFQGQERKVIIMATTRSNEWYHPRKALGFVMNPRRMSVAITRAQSMLIMVGDPEVLGKDPFWRTFLNYIRLRGGSKGKEAKWEPHEEVRVPVLEIIPRRGGVVYGKEFIDGKSDMIYRYYIGDG
ncbi:P-loop containing nucleoside triphosphate hydrolase protein [Russula earlei]|uniref:P-loop containing nucleoside triphosphate hydrolase protein n=1 Tax=Russula earlei TaxID=71964 RepID=A0ACC0TX02_9AGAM|nr:P-loop containing nucleoside triphosphate hydrolase protein [Russula earlei]